MLALYANIAQEVLLKGVSNFVDIDRLVAQINLLILQNDERQKKMKKLELDLCQIQEKLEYYYILSREQAKIIESNEKLHKRTIDLLGKSYRDNFQDFLFEEWWSIVSIKSKKTGVQPVFLTLLKL